MILKLLLQKLSVTINRAIASEKSTIVHPCVEVSEFFFVEIVPSELVYKLGLLPIAKAEEALSGILFDNKLEYTIGHTLAQMASSPFHAFMS